jgi:hypothetical protein
MELITNGEQYIGYIVINFFLMIVGYYIANNYPKFAIIRKVPSLDSITEAIKSAAERGRNVFFSPGGLQANTPIRAIFVPGVLSIAQHTSLNCGKLGVPLYSVVGDSTMNLLTIDALRSGFVESGHPEAFSATRHFFVGSPQSNMYESMYAIGDYNCGTVIMTGTFNAGTNCPVYEYASKKDAIIVGAEIWPHEESHAVVGADYVLLPEEMMVAGVYLGTVKDPGETFITTGNDLIKLFAIGALVALTLLTFAGLR